tara:strand:+ start:1892 stop:2053 length:162 start_codon:yes stop_codon:yes gene_type:complete
MQSAIKEAVTITKDEYEDLLESATWLQALEAAGVDNWHGIDFAHTLLQEEMED